MEIPRGDMEMEHSCMELGCAAVEKEAQKATFLRASKKAKEHMGEDILLFSVPNGLKIVTNDNSSSEIH